MDKQLYGEILFLGECNYNCYYCLKQEMDNLRRRKENSLNVHFLKWKNFDKYLKELHNQDITKIYLSSTCTDPLLYEYLYELVNYLKNQGFKVGVRSNGCLAIEKFDIIKEFNSSISFSINTFNKETNRAITGTDFIPNYDELFKMMERNNIKSRISIVVNKYNYKEVPEMINKLLQYSNSIKYIQLRKVYKYYNEVDKEEMEAFEYIKDWIKKETKSKKMYFESEVYEYNGLEISLWENVFNIANIQSFNYFTNGLISNHNLLVPLYEEDMTNMDVNDYYNNVYDEDKRLSDDCDNRHKVEREVKKMILTGLFHDNCSILEIGAGTGLYSIEFAKRGYHVSACDIVQKHVDIIKKKSELNNVAIDVKCADALNLPYESEIFDVVLLAGPIYHLHNVEDKIKAISEALRCCKPGGYIVVDYLSDVHGYIQHVLISKDYLLDKNPNDFYHELSIDEMFSYDNKKKIERIMQELGVNNLKFYSTDSITRFIKSNINALNNEELKQWITFIKNISDNENIVDLGEHCLAIGTKVKKLKRN